MEIDPEEQHKMGHIYLKGSHIQDAIEEIALKKQVGDLSICQTIVEALFILNGKLPQDVHHWECVSPGLYDTSYKCTRCKKGWVEQADNPIETELPLYGCPGHDFKTSEETE